MTQESENQQISRAGTKIHDSRFTLVPYWSRKRYLTLLLGAVTLVIVVALGTAWGSLAIPPITVARMLLGQLPWLAIPPNWPATWETVLFQVRLPRVVLSGLVGAALALAGAVYQGLFRNPLADPYLIGVSSGAGLGATLAIYFTVQVTWAGLGAISIFAFFGALLATAIIYALARVGGKTPVTTLLLAGVALGAFLSSITTYLMLSGKDAFHTFHVVSWMMGSLALANWQQVRVLIPYLLVGSAIILVNARPLNVLQLDEEQAQQLGLNVERIKLALVVAASLITASAVAVSGIIGFVGLTVPHAVRLVWGADHRFLLPMTTLVGAIFLILADGVARTLLSPSELPVGVITAFCGAPFFLYLLRQKKQAIF
jgi:iron complex transport system permease protein